MAEQLDLNPEDTPFEFPSRFPIKVMGEVDAGIEALVQSTLMEQHNIPDLIFTSDVIFAVI